MARPFSRLRTLLRRPTRSSEQCEAEGEACSWDAMRAVYAEQARRGDPEAARGLELIDQGRWPSSGRPRGR